VIKVEKLKSSRENNMDLKQETKEYLQYIRSHPCLICGQVPVDADHLDTRGMGGGGKRGRKGTHTGTMKDFSCIPLCRIHHTERHSSTLDDFQNKYNINLWKEAFKAIRDWYTT
tara:strand:- start:497 stop:838 length:342 start_codon:yes stop_codon:yes gene_type:complete